MLLYVTSVALAGEITVESGGSIADALRQAREWRRTADARCLGGITITVKAGNYYMHEPLLLRPEDSGTQDSPTIIQGEKGTTLSGDPMQTHQQLWPAEGMLPIKAFNIDERTIAIVTPPKNVLRQIIGQQAGLEMIVHQRWAIAILRIKEVKVLGDSTILSFMEPESRLEFQHPWPQPVIGGERGNSSFLIRRTEQRWGKEQLVIIDGASNIELRGLTFENTCWNRPLTKGHVTLQGGFPLIDAYKLKEKEGLPWDSALENQAWVERPVSAVTVRNAGRVSISDCCFRNIGSTALDFEGGVSDCTVSNSEFRHIGGTAIMAGSFAESPREVHRPYTDLAAGCRHLTISGNTISDASCEDWGAVGIACGYVKDTKIVKNSVSHVNYSGICVGWGWTPLYTGMERNRIEGNDVSDYARQLYDAGGIYTLSNQPQSVIARNSISKPHDAPYATNNRAFTIYLDARTDGFRIYDNQCEGTTIMPEQLGYNHPGNSIVFD